MVGEYVYLLMSKNVDDELQAESVHATMVGLEARKLKMIKEFGLSKEEIEDYFEDIKLKIQP